MMRVVPEYLLTSPYNHSTRQMDISDNLLCLYSARVTEESDTYTIEVPKREIRQENIQSGETYRVAIISTPTKGSHPETDTESEETPVSGSSPPQSREAQTQPPVSEGETREVEIENLGDQGDGIAKIDRGYVVIVPDTEVGERVTVRLEEVRENVAFAEVLKRHYDVAQERS